MKRNIEVKQVNRFMNGTIIAARVQDKNITFFIDKKGLFSQGVVTAKFIKIYRFGSTDSREVNLLGRKPRLASIGEMSDLAYLWTEQYGTSRAVAIKKYAGRKDEVAITTDTTNTTGTDTVIEKSYKEIVDEIATKYQDDFVIPSFLRKYTEENTRRIQ